MGVQNTNADRANLEAGQQSSSHVKKVISSLKTQLFAESLRRAESCIICLDKFRSEDIVSEATCKARHIFHSHCLTEWLH